MLETLLAILPDLWLALGQTLLMLAICLVVAVLLGGPLGVLLFLLAPGQMLQQRALGAVLGWLVNTLRSFPFIILLVAAIVVYALYGVHSADHAAGGGGGGGAGGGGEAALKVAAMVEGDGGSAGREHVSTDPAGNTSPRSCLALPAHVPANAVAPE